MGTGVPISLMYFHIKYTTPNWYCAAEQMRMYALDIAGEKNTCSHFFPFKNNVSEKASLFFFFFLTLSLQSEEFLIVYVSSMERRFHQTLFDHPFL